MQHDAFDDILILAERFRLGIPLLGMDGRDIPLRDACGRTYGPIEAALLLVESAITRMPRHEAVAYRDDAIKRATLVEDAAVAAGIQGAELDARITGVLVSAAVRADVKARHVDASPSDLNRATLGWYEIHHLRRAELLSAGQGGAAVGRTA